MKKIIPILTLLALPAMSMAQTTEPPADILYKKGMYGLKISQNGKYIGSMAGDASVYDVENGVLYDYWTTALGLGNCIADNGLVVGDSQDHGTIMYQGNIIYPEVFNDYWFCDIHAVTPDATRIVGIVNNPGRGQRYLPFYCDLSPEGEVGEINFLPYPTRDFFERTPQYSSAVWISNDGKTIVGEMIDGRGLYTVPIVYLEGEDGKWDYYLPSEPLFNPTDLPLPKMEAGPQGPPRPNIYNYMNEVEKLAYDTAYEQWQESGYLESLYPDPINYMTPENAEAYQKALAEYEAWAAENDPDAAMRKFVEQYNAILMTSPSFTQNEMTIDPNGEFILFHATILEPDYEERPYIYKFATRSEEYERYNVPAPFDPYPSLVLSDGTWIAATRLMEVPTSFVVEEGSSDFVPFFEYIGAQYPEAVLWMEEEFPGGSGLVSMSDDKSVMLGALIPDQLAYFDFEFSDFYYSTYIFVPGSQIGGVETIEAFPTEEATRIYNLQGIRIDKPVKGLNIINGKKVIL